ncbi:clathrin heavy chain linker domain-containing protein 1 [Stegastes partitus]|uniref:Clathrin heavy chain linker domain-containing protein 1 n=1 Tax=Stegastes partitus TaxID=144197 RepID=A0A9Y4K1P5_9TELE|nr:PREDICTED: clathrin heavy chain linker domain-containing protein 1 [Stegastes partitus]
MSETPNRRSSSSTREERVRSPDVLVSGSDERFFRSLYEFIEHEKKYLQSPEEGPDELRYIIYRSVFNKVIGRATAYKRLLLTIKAEYDDSIRELKRREEEVQACQRSKASSTSRPASLEICRRRAAQLTDRISVLQRETSELNEQIDGLKSRKEQSSWIPGVTVAQSEDLDSLNRHLEELQRYRAALMDTKSQSVSLEVRDKMDAELQEAERRREKLNAENQNLRVLYERLRNVCDHLSSWEVQQQVPLQELIGSMNLRRTSESDDDAHSVDAELFDEPTGLDESGLLAAHLDRFMELFDSAQFQEAALLAARSPPGVLRNLHTMEMFRGVSGPPGSAPPPLLFFRALLISVQTGGELSAALSLQGVVCALQHGDLRLVVHAVTQNKLTFSEDLGDVLTEHAQKNPAVADMCLALATVVYEACRLDRKSALSMCRRGLVHSAAEFMKHSEDLTAEDCMWVLCRSPSLSLLQLLTEPRRGRAAMLSVGGACAALLVDPQRQQLALQLLDGFMSRGRGVLDEAILEDSGSSVDVWVHVASLCSELRRADLSRAVLSVLLDQSGTRVLSPDLQGARLMEHVLL